jgi:hypothetical protein
MRILEVIPARHWVNLRNGRTASVYGAVPYTSKAEEADWEVQDNGWTWRNDNGTVGLGRVPAKTREEALEVMRKNNARLDEARARYAQPTRSYEEVLAIRAALDGYLHHVKGTKPVHRPPQSLTRHVKSALAQSVDAQRKALQGIIHHDAGTREADQLPRSLMRQVTEAVGDGGKTSALSSRPSLPPGTTRG